jgi:hypothetical protein
LKAYVTARCEVTLAVYKHAVYMEVHLNLFLQSLALNVRYSTFTAFIFQILYTKAS